MRRRRDIEIFLKKAKPNKKVPLVRLAYFT
jgi:hypothetical protein